MTRRNGADGDIVGFGYDVKEGKKANEHLITLGQ